MKLTIHTCTEVLNEAGKAESERAEGNVGGVRVELEVRMTIVLLMMKWPFTLKQSGCATICKFGLQPLWQ